MMTKIHTQRELTGSWVRLFVAAVVIVVGLLVTLVGTQTAHGATVQQVSTGYDSACALASGKVKCWGNNASGQLGNHSTSTSTSPVAVYDAKNPAPIIPSPCGGWFQPSCTPVPQPSSPIAGRYVEKVSVGRSHTCALADARVFCWGDNSHGQLGNNSNTSSTIPVAVAINDAVVAGPTVCKSSFLGVCVSWGPSTPAVHGSALRQKEVVDIVAGEYFTCAAASDGTVACWGEGDNGRLGTNSIADTKVPTAVYVQAALSGKKAIALSRVADAAVCVLAVNKAEVVTSRVGNPYCWGMGMGDGALPAGKTTTSNAKVNKNSCNSGTSTSTRTAYFDALQPVQFSATQRFSEIAANQYANAVGTDSKVYYWGLNGYLETVTKKVTCGGGAGGNGLDSSGNMCGGGSNHGSPGCAAKVNQKTVKVYTYSRIGKQSPAGPVYNNVRTLSGDVSGLFCGTGGTTFCDAHGTSMNEGQTGSGYQQHCTTTLVFGIFPKTECDPAPTGPQQVVTSGALSGVISNLDTGVSGFTCAVANGSVSCWGANSKGQLGVGDTNNRNTPTAVVNL